MDGRETERPSALDVIDIECLGDVIDLSLLRGGDTLFFQEYVTRGILPLGRVDAGQANLAKLVDFNRVAVVDPGDGPPQGFGSLFGASGEGKDNSDQK